MEWPNDYVNKIIQGDCLEVMKKLPDKSVDLVLTDPPYGIGVAKRQTFGGAGLCSNTVHKIGSWDNQIPAREIFDEIFRVSRNQIICGGNYFVEYLTNDALVKSRHTGENRCPVFCNMLKFLDSGFHRNDDSWAFLTFDEFINQ